MKKIFLFLPVFIMLLFSACSNDDILGQEGDVTSGEEGSSTPEVPEKPDGGQEVDYENAVVIAFSDSVVKVDNPFKDAGVVVEDNNGHIIINSSITDVELNYVLSGSISNGSVKIYGEKKFGLVLNGVGITNPSGAADLNGLDFVRSLAEKPLVVFTTAYSEFAFEGFRVDALDYLLKPVSYRDFLRSAEKARKQFELMQNVVSGTPQVLLVKSEYKVLNIDVEKIIYIESRAEYVRFHIENSKPVMSLGSLKSYEEKLSSSCFMRIHRSYIVNLKKIIRIERKHIIIGNDKYIPIGEVYEENFRKYLKENL